MCMSGRRRLRLFSGRNRAWRTLRQARAREQAGDSAGAEVLYLDVMDSGVIDAAADAAIVLGALRTRNHDLDGAVEVYERVRGLPGSPRAAEAALGLATLAVRQGRPAEARAVLEQLATSADPAVAATARTDLAVLAMSTGEGSPADTESLSTAEAQGEPWATELMHLFRQAGLRMGPPLPADERPEEPEDTD